MSTAIARQTETDGQRDRGGTERDRQTDTERDRDSDREGQRQRERQRDTEDRQRDARLTTLSSAPSVGSRINVLGLAATETQGSASAGRRAEDTDAADGDVVWVGSVRKT